MRVYVDKTLCTSCGVCEGLVPEVFSLAGGSTAEVLVETVPPNLVSSVEQAVEDCPEGAILSEQEQ